MWGSRAGWSLFPPATHFCIAPGEEMAWKACPLRPRQASSTEALGVFSLLTGLRKVLPGAGGSEPKIGARTWAGDHPRGWWDSRAALEGL